MLESDFVFTLSLPVYIIFLVVWLLRKKKASSILFFSLFYFYVMTVISVTLFPLPVDKTYIEDTKEVHDMEDNNYIPFTFLSDAIVQLTPVPHDTFGYDFRLMMVMRQTGGNILLGMPFGFLLPLVFEKRNSFFRVMVAGFYFSFAIEASQFLMSRMVGYSYRLTDVDDILLNCLGVALGYSCLRVFVSLLKAMRPIKLWGH